MNDFDIKVNQIITQRFSSMSNMETGNHAHNGYDVNQLDPAVSLLGWPTIQATDATVAPTDTPTQGTFRFYVDQTPNYRMWLYTVYSNSSNVLVGAWKSITLTSSGSGTVNSVSVTTANGISGTVANPTTTPAISLQLGAPTQTGKTVSYNNISTAGWGIPSIYGSGRSTGKIAAVASVATYTVGGTDGSFLISANVNVTTSTTHNFGVVVTYTDETNTSRSLTLPMVQLAGTVVAAITNVTGAGPYEGTTVQIRAKASTTITITTAGTFTSVTYNVEGSITQIA